jgi:transmembrane sensor
VRHVLRPGLDDLAAGRIWRRLEQRRGGAVRLRRRIGAWGAAVAALLVATTALVVLLRRPGEPAGALRLAGSADLAVMASPYSSPRAFVFSDGSQVHLGAEGRLDVAENDGKALVAILGGGSARFDVQPGGPRRWTIECGLATVEVVGTSFTLDREPGRLRVAVEHGVVLVRGDRVPDRIQRLTQGQSIEVTEPRAEVATPRPAPAPIAPPQDSRPKWRELARRGDYATAYRMLGADGVEGVVKSGGAADLLAVADVARLSGHPADAVAPLRRVVAEHPRDPGAPIAAFTLGRVELDSLDDPADAADAFAQAIALGMPQGLVEDAYARLVEARAKAGDAAGARRAASQYTQRFPGGARTDAVRRWAGAP